MKKTITLILSAFVLIFLLSACSENTAPKEDNSNDDVSSASSSEFIANMINPLVKSDADEVELKLGFYLAVPEGAENVEYYILSGDTEELRFKLDGLHYTARMKSAVEFEDISGMYYSWSHTFDDKIGWCDCKLMRHNGEKGDIDVCLWYDVVPGLMYSLTTSDTSLDGFDITAIARRIYVPMQTEVG